MEPNNSFWSVLVKALVDELATRQGIHQQALYFLSKPIVAKSIKRLIYFATWLLLVRHFG